MADAAGGTIRGVARLDGFERRSCLPPAWMRRRLPFHLYRLAFLRRFVRGVARLRPDVVHAHDAAMLLPGIVGARLTGARLVYDSHELATSVPYRERAWAWFVAGDRAAGGASLRRGHHRLRRDRRAVATQRYRLPAHAHGRAQRQRARRSADREGCARSLGIDELTRRWSCTRARLRRRAAARC